MVCYLFGGSVDDALFVLRRTHPIKPLLEIRPLRVGELKLAGRTVRQRAEEHPVAERDGGIRHAKDTEARARCVAETESKRATGQLECPGQMDRPDAARV